MKRFIPLLILSILTVVGTVTSFGQAGIFTGTIGISANGGGLAWYSLVSQTNNGAGLFGGAFLGTFNITSGNTLSLGGAEGLIFKNENAGADVTSVTLNYRIYLTSGTPGSFLTAPRDFTTGSGVGSGSVTDANGNVFTPGTGFRNQKWANNPGGSPIPLNVLSGLSNGDYTLEVYFSGTTNGQGGASPTITLDNGGANYKATFSVVPEPSISALLAGPILLGAWFFIRRRRA